MASIKNSLAHLLYRDLRLLMMIDFSPYTRHEVLFLFKIVNMVKMIKEQYVYLLINLNL